MPQEERKMEQFAEGESTREEIKNKLRQNFDGKIVRKDLTKKIKEGANVPVYVLEFLLGQYCSSDDETVIEKGVQIWALVMYRLPMNIQKNLIACSAAVSGVLFSWIMRLKATITLVLRTLMEIRFVPDRKSIKIFHQSVSVS